MRIGQKVKLKTSSEFFGYEGQLPNGVIGIVVRMDAHIRDEIWYDVEWKTPTDWNSNKYREEDLILCDFKIYYEKVKQKAKIGVKG
jgi:hypothetical protein